MEAGLRREGAVLQCLETVAIVGVGLIGALSGWELRSRGSGRASRRRAVAIRRRSSSARTEGLSTRPRPTWKQVLPRPRSWWSVPRSAGYRTTWRRLPRPYRRGPCDRRRQHQAADRRDDRIAACRGRRLRGSASDRRFRTGAGGAHARAGLLRDRVCVLTPTPRTAAARSATSPRLLGWTGMSHA